MIYFMKFSNSKPKRIDERYALDFYQMWFGNDEGQYKFDRGTTVRMPGIPDFQMWGEDIVESVWFKKILTGAAEDGFVEFDGTLKTTADSWHT